MYLADKLYDAMMEVDAKIKTLEVTDEASMAEYIRLYTELIYDHKWIGSIYDIYADDAKLYRENGVLFEGSHAIMQETMKFCSCIPNLKLQMRDCFAVKKSETCYKVWRYFVMEGNNLNYSIYGPATGKALNPDEMISMSMATVELIDGSWLITRDCTMYSIDCVEAVCTMD
ncbi:MAG: hypothetical protein Q4B22_00640 [Eubacteriales bacterium]|nr:hypothetical protein [Eubacteriales bacterium]